MKHIIILLYVLSISALGYSQNVGINDSVPSAKLSVKGAETTADGQAASIKLQNTAPGITNAWFLRAGALGNNTPNGGFSIADNTGYRFNITNTGNIGIGTTMPSEQLTLQSGNISLLSSTKGILLNGFDGPMINRGFDAFTTGSLTGLGRWGLFMEPNNLTIGLPALPFKAFAISTYNSNSTINKQLLKVSVDPSTNALVEVNGAMKIEGANTIEFGAGVAGKELNAGKIGYNSFGPQGLSIVGSGTTAFNRKVYVFAEGGTTFNGPINVGGSTGTAGQVLTSNGTGVPTWETLSTPFKNVTRFSVGLRRGPSEGSNCLLRIPANYNLEPSTITIDADGITLNKAGLYHFDIMVYATYQFISAPIATPPFSFILFKGGPPGYVLVNEKPMQSVVNNPSNATTFRLSEKLTFDIHVMAGRLISLSHAFGMGGGVFYDVNGYINGYLISE